MSIDIEKAVVEFDRDRLSIYEALLGELLNARRETESADFAGLFRRVQSVLGRSDLHMSRLFKVSRPTVNRWNRGVTKPHPLLRQAVFDTLLAEVKDALKQTR